MLSAGGERMGTASKERIADLGRGIGSVHCSVLADELRRAAKRVRNHALPERMATRR